MFANIVKNLYIGKSKVDFVLNDKLLSGTNKVGDIGEPFKINSTLSYVTRLPDYFIMGRVTDICTLDISPCSNKDNKDMVKLYITGVPKDGNLDDYKLNYVTWESYYEDSHRGYLFQMMPATSPFILKYV